MRQAIQELCISVIEAERDAEEAYTYMHLLEILLPKGAWRKKVQQALEILTQRQKQRLPKSGYIQADINNFFHPEVYGEYDEWGGTGMKITDRKNVEVRENGLYLGDRQLLDFIPRIEKVKKTLTSMGCRMSYKVEISKNGKTIQTAWIHKLYVKSWFDLSDQCSDADLSDKERRSIERYLQKQVPGLPIYREIYLDKSGWQSIDSGKIFYNKCVITKALADVIRTKDQAKVVQIEEYRFDANRAGCLLKGIQCVSRGTSWIVYMASYFDVLKELFKKAGYPIECIINVYGKSGMGKTSLIKTLCSPSHVFSFSQPQRRDKILREIQKYEGHTVLVDDYHPAEQKYDGERQNALKDSLVRLVEENKNAPNIIISSEGLGGHVSMQDREVQIFLGELINWELLTALQQEQGLLEKIRIAFYVQVVNNEDAIVDEIKDFCLKSDKKRTHDIHTSLRSGRYLDYIRCAANLFQKYFFDVYGIAHLSYDIDPDIHVQLERKDKHMKIIKEWNQKGTCLITLRDMLSSPDILKLVKDGKEFVASADTIYVNGQKRVILSAKALRFGMMRYLQTTDIPIKRIVRELADAEVLITYENGNELTQKVNGKRCYVIDIDGLNEYCDIFGIGGTDRQEK